jgi:hypothetical protein
VENVIIDFYIEKLRTNALCVSPLCAFQETSDIRKGFEEMPKVKKHDDKSTGRASASAASRKRRPAAQTDVTTPLSPNARLGARTEFRIYPSIGIARIGDSKDGYIIGPEAPGVVPTGPFRGADKGIKPQAARFRIYEVKIDANGNERVLNEVVPGVNANRVKTEIEWTVTLANRKAAGFKIIDTLARNPKPGLRNKGLDREKLVISASGKVPCSGTGSGMSGPVLSGEIEFAKPRGRGPKVTDIVLAKLRTDEKGRLLIVGGPGKSDAPPELKCDIDVFDSDGWYDSVSDGPVCATLHISNQSQPIKVIPAWVVVTVPRYAPGIYGVVTWYDQAVSMARTNANGIFNPPSSTSFTRDIYPILKRADSLSAVHDGAHATRQLSADARIASYAAKKARCDVRSKLTPIRTKAGPTTKDGEPGVYPPGLMPRLKSGANPDPNPDPDNPVWIYLALTKYQMAHIDNWVAGTHKHDWPGEEPAPTQFEKIPKEHQAWALTEAALEACVGGAFYPGIEGTTDIARMATYHPESHLRREFRINPAHPAGFLTEKMALPWQADFQACGQLWWPSQRPVHVTTKDGGKREDWNRGISDWGDGVRRNGFENMVHFWSKLGFVVFDERTGTFVEDERTLETETSIIV